MSKADVIEIEGTVVFTDDLTFTSNPPFIHCSANILPTHLPDTSTKSSGGVGERPSGACTHQRKAAYEFYQDPSGG